MDIYPDDREGKGSRKGFKGQGWTPRDGISSPGRRMRQAKKMLAKIRELKILVYSS